VAFLAASATAGLTQKGQNRTIKSDKKHKDGGAATVKTANTAEP